MKIELLGQELKTDYFRDCERNWGVPWCYVQGNTWHILLPHPPNGPWPNVLHARPVLSEKESDLELPAEEKTRRIRRWRWRLEIGVWHLPLGRGRFLPYMPVLIDKFTMHKRQAVCYCSAKPGGDFARVSFRGPLVLVRDDQGMRWPRGQRERRRNFK